MSITNNFFINGIFSYTINLQFLFRVQSDQYEFSGSIGKHFRIFKLNKFIQPS